MRTFPVSWAIAHVCWIWPTESNHPWCWLMHWQTPLTFCLRKKNKKTKTNKSAL